MTADQQISNIDRIISKSLASSDPEDRGLLSQHILGDLRHLVEACMVRFTYGDRAASLDMSTIKHAVNHVASMGKYKFLSDFHQRLQASKSHYTLDEDGSIRLMLRYLDYLYKLRDFVQTEFGYEILTSLEDYPIRQSLQAPYRKAIAHTIDAAAPSEPARLDVDRYYVWRSTPFFVDGKVYYEVTLTSARDQPSNTDHFVTYSAHSILPNHAVRVSMTDARITVDGFNIPITIILAWSVSIRPCELKCMAQILNIGRYETSGRDHGYQLLMSILTRHMSSILDVAKLSQAHYGNLKSELLRTGAAKEAGLLDALRKAIQPGMPGANIISYLAYGMRYGVLKAQLDSRPNYKLTNLHLQNGSIGFDEMPLCTNPLNHVPRLSDVLLCVESDGREHELLCARLTRNAEREGLIFTPEKDLPFSDIEKLQSEFNELVYRAHKNRRTIDCHNGHYYIRGYVNDAIDILSALFNCATSGVPGYSRAIENAISNATFYGSYNEEKKDALRELFVSSKVAAIYGSAGTGKSTFISLVSQTTQGNKLFMAYTHAAVENLKKRVGEEAGDFMTVESFRQSRAAIHYVLVVVDECSTVPNETMRIVLDKLHTERLLLVGDECQIGSIRFGNWFELCKRVLPKAARFTLHETFRTGEEDLLTLWKRTRERDLRTSEFISKNGFTSRLSPEIFTRASEDEVVLCLSYNGLYGVNNINRILQQSNDEAPIEWRHRVYKVGDPIVFGNTRRFQPVIYNNSKGTIRRIEKLADQIRFDIEVQSHFTNASGADLLYLGNPTSYTTLVRINVFLTNDETDEETSTEYSKTVMPFQIAYAMSIHKAQGLEYDSVKLVIPCEVDDLVTHDIFYTGVTRAKRRLRIYWEPESQEKILESFEGRDGREGIIKKELTFLKQIAKKRGNKI